MDNKCYAPCNIKPNKQVTKDSAIPHHKRDTETKCMPKPQVNGGYMEDHKLTILGCLLVLFQLKQIIFTINYLVLIHLQEPRNNMLAILEKVITTSRKWVYINTIIHQNSTVVHLILKSSCNYIIFINDKF